MNRAHFIRISGWWLLLVQGVLLLLLLVFGIRYHKEFSVNLSAKYGRQISGTANTARLSAENYFRKYSENLVYLSHNPHVIEMARRRDSEPCSYGYCPMEELFAIHRDEIDALFLMDTTSLVIKRIGNDTIEPDHMNCIGNTMANPVVPKDSVYYSGIFVNHKNQKAITLSCPVYDGLHRIGIVRWMVTIESVERYFRQAMAGQTGGVHFVVLDSTGRLLSSEGAYLNWLAAHGCDLGKAQGYRPVIRGTGTSASEGNGILTLAKPGCRVNAAWSSFRVGDGFWKLMVMLPAAELDFALKQHRTITVGVMAFAMLIVLSMTWLIFTTRSRKLRLEREAVYLSNLADSQTQLNRERGERLSAQIAGQEQERRRLSRELHDGLGQMLLALKLRMQGVNRLTDGDTGSGGGQGHHPDASQLLEQAITEVKRISDGLSPVILYELGIVKAAEKYCREISSLAGIVIDFVHHGISAGMDKDTETHLFRIIQEGISNAIRHGQANEVNIQLLGGVERVTLIIQDNGCGFEPNDVHHSKGSGLDNMRDRVNLLGGHFEINTYPGGGTTITARVGLKHKA
jgi:signal transduction histidine kinase